MEWIDTAVMNTCMISERESKELSDEEIKDKYSYARQEGFTWEDVEREGL